MTASAGDAVHHLSAAATMMSATHDLVTDATVLHSKHL